MWKKSLGAAAAHARSVVREVSKTELRAIPVMEWPRETEVNAPRKHLVVTNVKG
jgi:hypothetical protein